jgi:predicted DNA binding protein
MIEIDVTLPPAAIPPGTALAETDTLAELVRQVPIDGAERQYLRVIDSDDRDGFETIARADPGVTRLTAVDRAATPLYRIEWRNSPPCPTVYRPDLLVERMDETPDGWVFRLRAGDGEVLQSLQRECRDLGRNFAVRRLDRSATDSDPATDQYGLTARQREVLMTAIDAGFFAIPRETTLADLAAELDISDQAVSDHLRRAQRNLLQATVLDDPAADFGQESDSR